jgi:uncharacterized protein
MTQGKIERWHRSLKSIITLEHYLRSPAGIGLGALVYNYDGKVFASDEGRMLAEMGDNTFELGHVNNANYRDLILSDKLVELVGSSLTQCAPKCLNCVYESGANPVYHHATQKDAVGIKPLSGFCARQKGGDRCPSRSSRQFSR